LRALTLRANALIAAQQPQQAIDALTAEPETPKQPALLLLLGQASVQVHHALEAVAAFQNVYYYFPLSSQAKAADDALKELREQLGSAYPAPHVEYLMARADALYKGGRYDDALQLYLELQRDEAASPLVPNWQLAQARCQLRLHRGADALQAFAVHLASPELDAQRLLLIVQVHVQQADAPAVTQDLAQFEASYASSPAYADALSAAGMFFYRQLNWQEAARAYQRGVDLFPQSEHARDDSWRLAWCYYLLNDPKTSEAIRHFLTAFPDAPRAPSAIYWLGRTQEDNGSSAEARALYTLITKQYPHTYYATQATARLAAMRSAPAKPDAGNDTNTAPIATELRQALTPPVVPHGLGCLGSSPPDTARPAVILQALDLKTVEEDYLRGALAESHPAAELRLLLVRLLVAQHETASALFTATRIAPAYPQMEFSDLPKELWDYIYPRAYWQLVQRQARVNKISPYLVMGLMRQESAFDPHALSSANARGLMQLLPETAAHSTRRSRTRTAARRLNDPSYNVRSGCAYLATMLKMFNGTPEYALAAYNAGDFRVRDWEAKYNFRDTGVFLESIPIPATRGYVEAVLRDAEVYRQLLSGSPRFALCSAAPSAVPVHHPAPRPRPHAAPASTSPAAPH
jgi:soluble lytic murein transglycosylase